MFIQIFYRKWDNCILSISHKFYLEHMRKFIKKNFRYYNYLKDKINLVHDILDTRRHSSNYYTPKNPLDKKIDPV